MGGEGVKISPPKRKRGGNRGFPVGFFHDKPEDWRGWVSHQGGTWGKRERKRGCRPPQIYSENPGNREKRAFPLGLGSYKSARGGGFAYRKGLVALGKRATGEGKRQCRPCVGGGNCGTVIHFFWFQKKADERGGGGWCKKGCGGGVKKTQKGLWPNQREKGVFALVRGAKLSGLQPQYAKGRKNDVGNLFVGEPDEGVVRKRERRTKKRGFVSSKGSGGGGFHENWLAPGVGPRGKNQLKILIKKQNLKKKKRTAGETQ